MLCQPAIVVREPRNWGPVDAALERLSSYDWLVFSSANGVRGLLDRLVATGRDLRGLGGLRLAAIGPATAHALAEYHLRTDLQPHRYQAEDLAADLGRQAVGQRFLLARASRGREVLADDLQAAGGGSSRWWCTRAWMSRRRSRTWRRGWRGADRWTTVTSSAIARSLWALFGNDLRQTRLVSISPVTSATLRELGLEPAAEAAEATMSGVVDMLCHRGPSRR